MADHVAECPEDVLAAQKFILFKYLTLRMIVHGLEKSFRKRHDSFITWDLY